MKSIIKSIRRRLILTTVVCTSLLTTGAAFADAAPNNTAQQVNSGVSQAFGAATSNILNALYVYLQDCQTLYAKWVSQLMQMNAGQYAMSDSQGIAMQSGKDTTAMIYALMTPPNLQLKNGAQSPIPYLFSPGLYASMVPVSRDETGAAQSEYLSSGSLLSTLQFDPSKEQAKKALTFIQFVANMGNRIVPLTSSTLKNADPSAVYAYLNSLASFNAGQSVPLNTLLNLYNERLPLPQLNGKSALATDQQAVLTRLQPQWTASVNKMTLVDVMRESLYTQAQTNYQLFQMRMQLEQLNMTMAMMALQQQQTLGKSLVMQYEQKVVSSAQTATTTN